MSVKFEIPYFTVSGVTVRRGQTRFGLTSFQYSLLKLAFQGFTKKFGLCDEKCF